MGKFKPKNLTIRQLFVLAIVKKEPNYVYSTWKILETIAPELNMGLSTVREIFLTLKRDGIIREMRVGLLQRAFGPKRRMFTITDKGKLTCRYYIKALEKAASAIYN